MAFSYKASITVDHTKVSSTDQTDFPILVSGTYAGAAGAPDLRSTGNGGKVQNSSGYDIYFYSDSALTTRIPAERETYNASTGAINFWVKKTVLSASDVVIYIAYGDSGIASDPNSDATYGKTSTWDSNFTGVWHLNDNAANTTVTDSVSSGHNGTNSVNTSSRTITGQIGTGLDYQGGDDTTMGNVLNTSWGTSVNFTLETWIKFNAAATSTKANFISKTGNAVPGPLFAYRQNSTNHLYYEGYDGTRNPFGYNTTSLSTGTWYHVAYTRNTGSSVGTFYVNGVADGTLTDNTTDMGNAGDNFHLGGDTANGGRVTAYMDESRVSNTNRTAGWLLTGYNNQNSPSTFYTMGSETSVSTLISRDAYTNGGSTTAFSLTYAHTCTGSNLLLLVQCSCLGGDVVTGVTYNSVAMTQLKKKSDAGVSQTTYIYGLLGPSTGSNNVVVSTSASVLMASNAASYVNVSQSNLPDASNSVENNTTTSTTLSVTTVANNCWAFLAANNGGAGSFVASTNSTLLANNVTGFCDSFDNGTVAPITPAGSFSMTVTSALSNHRIAMVSFAPVTTSAAASFTRKRMLVGIGQ